MHILWQDLALGPPSFSVLLDNIVHSPEVQQNFHKSAKSSVPFHPPNRYKQPQEIKTALCSIAGLIIYVLSGLTATGTRLRKSNQNSEQNGSS